jgi:hypothetical protein
VQTQPDCRIESKSSLADILVFDPWAVLPPDRQWQDVNSQTCHQPVIANNQVKKRHMFYEAVA